VPTTPGKVIVLNGASSAGKSTLGRALQARLDAPFLGFSLDFLMFRDGVLPPRRDPDGPFSWREMRPAVFEGYFACLEALAGAGNNVLTDIVLESREQFERLSRALARFDAFVVGVHCPLPELERRERERGDRGAGDARRDARVVHTFTAYDAEVDGTEPPERNAERLAEAWRERGPRGVLGRGRAP
jgi:chloramphenicol 3-O phosphotransferase